MFLNKKETRILQELLTFISWQQQEDLLNKGFSKEDVRKLAEKINIPQLKNYPGGVIKDMIDGKAIYY